MAHFTLPPRAVSRAMAHRTVEEVWFFLSGLGRMWRRLGGREETIEVGPGTSISIPVGTHFQFRSDAHEPLAAIGATMPPWPGRMTMRSMGLGRPQSERVWLYPPLGRDRGRRQGRGRPRLGRHPLLDGRRLLRGRRPAHAALVTPAHPKASVRAADRVDGAQRSWRPPVRGADAGLCHLLTAWPHRRRCSLRASHGPGVKSPSKANAWSRALHRRSIARVIAPAERSTEPSEPRRVIDQDLLAHRRVRRPRRKLVEQFSVVDRNSGVTSVAGRRPDESGCGQSVPQTMRSLFAAISAWARGMQSLYSGPRFDER